MVKATGSADKSLQENWSRQTQMVRAGSERSNFGEMSEAIYFTSGFAYNTAEEAEARFSGEDDGFTYSRQSNPNLAMFESRIALLEGTEVARATGTGMAAMAAALLCQLQAGDHVVAARALFGSCRWLLETLLPRYGIHTTLVDGRNTDAFAAAVTPKTKLFWLESPANPTLDMVDIAAVADIAHKHGARLVVDNVFATPVFQRPTELGADIVCYSATKHIDGQGRALGGVVACSAAFDEEFLFPYYRHTGPAMSPFNAWVLLKGLETLSLRVNAMADGAEAVFTHLKNKGFKSRYPFDPDFEGYALAKAQMARGGSMLTLELAGKDQAFAFLNALELVDISNNLGDSRSIATHPWTTTHKALAEESRLDLGITPGLLRLSIGLEDPQDLILDITRALEIAKAKP